MNISEATLDNIVTTISILLIVVQAFIAWKLAKRPEKLDVKILAFCLIFLSFDITIITTVVQFYLILKLYFIWENNHKENGDNKIDK